MLRAERRTASYQDLTVDRLSLDEASNDFHPGDRLWGGHASLSVRLTPQETIYLQVARGYKAGGFNLSQGLAPEETLFRPESDWNVEAGYKADLVDHRLALAVDVFALIRRDAQI